MKDRIIRAAVLSLLLLSSTLAARPISPTRSLPLYPAGQGQDAGIVENGVAVTRGPGADNGLKGGMQTAANGNISNVGDDARIDIYLPKRCGGQMLICCPGGGYGVLASRHEGENVARWCLERDIACCVVLYRLPNKHPKIPLTDVQNAFRYCRAHQQEWGVRQLGIIGFSAGGHLAALSSTLFDDAATRPDFSVLLYPVITLEQDVTHPGTRANLTGGWPASVETYSVENQVGRRTPPALLVLSGDDRTVPVENSFRYYKRLAFFRIPATMHVFPTGGHGWGFHESGDADDPLGARQRAEFDTLLENWLAAMATQP
ncbi:MAG: alpha/beta hydrolase [Bacteroidales bacterium]|nr:alpha/beta hydrolase [Bacteroidales bacterium]